MSKGALLLADPATSDPASALPAVSTGDRPLRVGFVVNNLNIGGLEKVVVSLICRLQEVGHHPYLICLNGAGKMRSEIRLPSDRVLIHEKRGVPVFGLTIDPALIWTIRRFCIEHRLDVLHAHNLAPLVYAGCASRLIWNRPKLVYSEHNQIYSAGASVRRRFSYYVRLADHIVAVSHDLRRELVEHVGDTRPIEVIHNGIESVDRIATARHRVRAELGAGEGDVLVGTVSVLSAQKGIAHLLNAVTSVCRRVPSARFVIVGDGPLRDTLTRQCTALGLDDRVLFTGYRSDIPAVMDALDIYVQPSLWEGLPLVLLEALRAGKPIVATRVGGNPEAVEHEVNGLLVEPANPESLAGAVIRAATDSHFRGAVPANNQAKFTREFALDAMVSAHVKLYSRMAGLHGLQC